MLPVVNDLPPAAAALIVLGGLLASSIFADAVASRTRLPRISLLVLVGLSVAIVQQLVLGLPAGRLLDGLGEPLVQVALVMVAFLLGGELTLARLRTTGPLILIVSLSVVGVGALAVGLGLWALGFPLAVAVSLAAISVATDPAAVQESIHASGDTRLRARLLLGIVAIDDAWGILVFGLAMSVLGWGLQGAAGGEHLLLEAVWELGGALLLGAVIGLPAAWLTGRLAPGQPTQVEAIALILLLAGLSTWLGVSSLLAAMVTGMLIANLSRHHTRSFSEIEHIEWPFLVFFFVLSGASVDLLHLHEAQGLILAYLALRLAGRLLGGMLGVRLARVRQADLPRDIGLALTPQAGVAMGMALLAAERFPEHGTLLLSTVVASTLVFETVGPMLVRRVLREAS
ncbi:MULTISPECIES: cation:proton antiporter [Halomonas]|uniref:Potassium transporter n=1 Tax=Halomonas halophila TaxID=29573 RepID=A0ABQ0U129_9GAMM|nr:MULTISPECIES: cation:proton antiporter [Halomonas]MDR5888688.1 cation:proton antiporter [Halomonas salina]RAH37669.1 cation:proton antiporter [Halomonas sp. SL1]WJY07868.1 cation:proton antiporter [Halomonas halophila]GEK71950.1 potassium transporter [Halomonas halophila]